VIALLVDSAQQSMTAMVIITIIGACYGMWWATEPPKNDK
jgi:hypothetical protein